MPVKIRKKGRYERFETTKGSEILVLDGEMWYALVQGQAGDIIVLTDSDHERRRTLKKGRFYLADFQEDPKFKDMLHLFMEADGAFEEALLPQHLPTQGDKQKKLVRTDDRIPKKDLEDYLRDPAPAGPGEERMGRPGGGSMANVTHHLKGIDLPASRSAIVDFARKRNAPRAVLEQLETLPGGRYRTMADVTKGIGEGKEPLPIEHYDDLRAADIPDRLDGLGRNDLERLRAYEEDNLGRKTVLRAIDRRLKE